MKQDQIYELSNLGDYDYENIFNIYQDSSGQYFYNLLNTINFPEDIDTALYDDYNLMQGDIWTSISYKKYGTIKLWWLVCAVNQIQNPLIIPAPGTKIKLLNNRAVSQVLKTIKE